MTDIWNEVNLTLPPVITVKVQHVNFVKQVRSLFLKRKASQFDYLQREIATTSALLSRLMARRKNSFHSMLGFKFVCKLNTALSRLLKLDVEQVLDNFYQTLPEPSSYNQNEVPSRNSFDYALLRLMSVHKIYQRIVFCCLESATYFNQLLKNNFFMETMTLFLAVISKIWNLSNKLGNIYSDLYSKLLPLRKFFPQIDSHGTFKQIDFPNKLDPFSKESNASETVSKGTEVNSITMDKEFVQTGTVTITKVLPKIQKEEDFGTPISRDSMKPLINLSRIHNIEDIRQFFKEEDEKRDKCMKTCTTKYIPKHEWLAIQKLVNRKIIANDHKKALSVFRKFITSKT